MTITLTAPTPAATPATSPAPAARPTHTWEITNPATPTAAPLATGTGTTRTDALLRAAHTLTALNVVAARTSPDTRTHVATGPTDPGADITYTHPDGTTRRLAVTPIPTRTPRVDRDPTCNYCQTWGLDRMAPAHDPSSRCTSGAPFHCPCDRCF